MKTSDPADRGPDLTLGGGTIVGDAPALVASAHLSHHRLGLGQAPKTREMWPRPVVLSNEAPDRLTKRGEFPLRRRDCTTVVRISTQPQDVLHCRLGFSGIARSIDHSCSAQRCPTAILPRPQGVPPAPPTGLKGGYGQRHLDRASTEAIGRPGLQGTPHQSCPQPRPLFHLRWDWCCADPKNWLEQLRAEWAAARATRPWPASMTGSSPVAFRRGSHDRTLSRRKKRSPKKSAGSATNTPLNWQKQAYTMASSPPVERNEGPSSAAHVTREDLPVTGLKV